MCSRYWAVVGGVGFLVIRSRSGALGVHRLSLQTCLPRVHVGAADWFPGSSCHVTRHGRLQEGLITPMRRPHPAPAPMDAPSRAGQVSGRVFGGRGVSPRLAARAPPAARPGREDGDGALRQRLARRARGGPRTQHDPWRGQPLSFLASLASHVEVGRGIPCEGAWTRWSAGGRQEASVGGVS